MNAALEQVSKRIVAAENSHPPIELDTCGRVTYRKIRDWRRSNNAETDPMRLRDAAQGTWYFRPTVPLMRRLACSTKEREKDAYVKRPMAYGAPSFVHKRPPFGTAASPSHCRSPCGSLSCGSF